MQQRLAGQEAPVVRREHTYGILGNRGRRGVTGDKNIWRAPERVIGWERLVWKHIQHRARETASGEGLNERGFIKGAAASRINKERVPGQCIDHRAIDDRARIGRVREHGHQVVEARREGPLLVAVKVPIDVGRRARAARVAMNTHAEMSGRRRQMGSDRSDAHEPQRLLPQRSWRRGIPASGSLRLQPASIRRSCSNRYPNTNSDMSGPNAPRRFVSL